MPATRSSDALVGATFASAHVFIEEGTDADTGYTCTNDQGSDVVGTDDLVFGIFSRLGFGVAPVGLRAANAEGTSPAASRANHEHARDLPKQETIAAEVITNTDTVMADALDFDPIDVLDVSLTLNGLRQDQGAGLDYTLGGVGNRDITWLADTGTAINMKASDGVKAKYSVQQ